MNATATVVLSSAAVGALTSSIIIFYGQALERRARKSELLLSKAIDLAELQTKSLQDYVKTTNKGAVIYPLVIYARWYHHQLKLLHSTGRISENLEQQFASFLNHSDTPQQRDEL